MNKKKGFTLIELLVVIAIIALLMSIVMPALGKAKYIAKEILCRSNLRQWALSSNVYAHDSDSKLPSFPVSRSGVNVWDVSAEFVTFDGEYQTYWDGSAVRTMPDPQSCVMAEYGMTEPELKYCPLASPDTKDNIEQYMDIWEADGITLLIGYNWWVPRLAGGVEFLSDHPEKTTDKHLSTRPIITDVVLAHGAVGPDYITDLDPYIVETDLEAVLYGLLAGDGVYTTHHRNGQLQKINMGFGDTHVETQNVSGIENHHSGHYKNYY